MLHLVARATLVTGALCVAGVVAGLAWLLYQPGGGTLNAYDAFMSAYEHDPSHSALYARSYGLLMRLTDGDMQHYVVHSVAALVATATGHPDAAREQEWRASQHHL